MSVQAPATPRPVPSARRRTRWAVRLGTALLWLGAVVFVIAMLEEFARTGRWGIDSHAYWLTAHRPSLYGLRPGATDAYLYSPVFATVIWPLTQLPWPVFGVLWGAIEFAAFAWLLRPLARRWRVPLLALCGLEALAGDIFGLMAVAAVVGMRRPGAWALPALTKITPAVGPVWFAVRGEWRAVTRAAAVTGAITVVSFVLTPGRWLDWFGFLLGHSGEGYFAFPLRLVVAAGLVVVGARTDRRWLVAAAVFMALPVWSNLWIFTVFAAVPRLRTAATVAPARPN